jgi:hypothetical protein
VDPIAYYVIFVRWIGDGTGASDTVLHIHAGMAVLLLARVITNRSLATPWPLAFVYLAEFVNEALDRVAYGRWMPDTFTDIVHTVFWPTVLFVGLRVRTMCSKRSTVAEAANDELPNG